MGMDTQSALLETLGAHFEADSVFIEAESSRRAFAVLQCLGPEALYGHVLTKLFHGYVQVCARRWH
jgi:hypothetical protein